MFMQNIDSKSRPQLPNFSGHGGNREVNRFTRVISLFRACLFMLTVTMPILACSGESAPEQSLVEEPKSDRDYTQEQVSSGRKVFGKNCARCHGIKAKGEVEDWKKTKADGSYPAPPLNGSAHAWHHDNKTLMRTVIRGGIPLGGTMPPFRDILSETEIVNVIVYIQNLWPEEIYQAWKQRNAGG